MDLRFQKWDGTVTRTFERHVVGTTPKGVVLRGTPQDRDRWRDDTTPSGWSVTWIPSDCFWIATWYSVDGTDIGFYGDVGTIVSTTPDLTMFLDLDLDVVSSPTGFTLVDQDELVTHALAMGYPPGVTEIAERAAADLLRELREGDLDDWGRTFLAAQITAVTGTGHA